jgi:hypothetical protein
MLQSVWSLNVKDFYTRCLWNVLDVNKAKGLGRNRCRNKKESSYRSAVTKRRKTASSVSCEKPEATVARLLLRQSDPDIVTVKLFDD